MTENRNMKFDSLVLKTEIGAFLRVCEGVDTPRSLCCWMLATYGEWDQYLGLQRPDTFSLTFRDDYLVTEMLTKNPLIPTTFDRLASAKEKWFWAESECRRTNDILDAYLLGYLTFGNEFENVLSRTQRIISDILGPLDRFALEYIEANFRFGPGATSSCSGIDVVPSRKMTSRLDVTPALYPYYRSIVPRLWSMLLPLEINLKAYNTVTFVPKNAKTDRAIAIEPHMNIYVQLGIGAMIRRRLTRAGLDLDTQADRNRHLASLAHSQGLCTIDLTSASDTIASRLVSLLLPPDWFSLLSIARSEYSMIDDQEVQLNKFSSMGNGFTFELETLIFYALSKACGSNTTAVFGDDIIVDQSCAALLIRMLESLGFSINKQKTCLAGTFFESCGADYNNGVNVRPFFLKGAYNDYTLCCIQICNKIRTYAHRCLYGYGCDARFLRAWLFSFSRDSRARSTCIAPGYGDNGLIRNWDEATPPRARHGHEGYAARVWRRLPVRSKVTDLNGAYLTALAWGTGESSSRLRENVRGRTRAGKHSVQVIPTWTDLGPWF